MPNISIFFILCLTALVHGAALHHMYYPDTGPDSSYIFLYSLNNSVTHHPLYHVRPYSNELHWLSSRSDTPRDKQKVPNAAVKRIPTPATPANSRATPAPTGDPSPLTTVHITDEKNFSLLAPKNSHGMPTLHLNACSSSLTVISNLQNLSQTPRTMAFHFVALVLRPEEMMPARELFPKDLSPLQPCHVLMTVRGSRYSPAHLV